MAKTALTPTRHIVRVSKPSLMKKTTATPFTCTTTTWPSAQGFSTGIGDDASRSETICSSLEGKIDTLTPANDHGTASMNVMSFTTLDNENGNVGENNYRHCMETLGPISDPERRTLSAISDTTRHYDPESQIQKGRDQERDLSTSTKTGVTTTATFLRQTAVALHTAVVKCRCATETYGYTEVRLGKGDYIPRWRRGSELTYTVNTQSFPTPAEAMLVKEAMQKAISMWKGIGASFKYLEVDYYDSATFVVRYDGRRCSNTYAISFFPDELPGELLVYNLALSNATHLANILAHEIGHILGLRHEFADKNHKEGRILRCVLFGKKNPRSVMNYYEDPEELQVSEQDLRELKEFYECNEDSYERLPIYDYDPVLRKRVSREETRLSHAMRKSGRRFSYRSLLGKVNSFISASFHNVK